MAQPLGDRAGPSELGMERAGGGPSSGVRLGIGDEAAKASSTTFDFLFSPASGAILLFVGVCTFENRIAHNDGG